MFDCHFGLPSLIILNISPILGENGFSKGGFMNFFPLKWSEIFACGDTLHIETNNSPIIMNMPTVIFFVIIIFFTYTLLLKYESTKRVENNCNRFCPVCTRK